MTGNNITDLRYSGKVSSVQRGVEHDWIVILDPGSGPAPNVAEMFADSTEQYELVEQPVYDGEVFAHFNEVSA